MNHKKKSKFFLLLNLGSSTVKFSIYEIQGNETTLIKQFSKKLSKIKDIKLFLTKLLKLQNKIDLIVFRVVHGGCNYPSPMILSEKVLAGIREGEKLAPIHNFILLQWYEVIKEIIQNETMCIACFDSSFFYDLPKLSKTYAIPTSLSKKYSIQKLGFHGFAHQSMLTQLENYYGSEKRNKKVITMQLGGGSSITACLNGNPIETSMGFSPLDGLMMSTRSGSIDPGIIIYLLKSGVSISEIESILNFQSGLKGITGIADYQTLIRQPSKNSRFAIDLYCRNIAKYLGAYITLLGGVDAIVFGGGIGENCHFTRKKIINYLKCFGVEIKYKINTKNLENINIISTTKSLVNVFVIKPNEEFEMLKSVQAFLFDL